MNVSDLIVQHRGYIIKLASKYSSDYDERQDLQQEGYLGIVDAAKYYDASHGTKFLSFAYKWIDGRMKSFLIRQMKAKGMTGRDERLLKTTPTFTNNEQIIQRVPQSNEDLVEQQRTEHVKRVFVQDFTSILSKSYKSFYRRRYWELRTLADLGRKAKVKEQNIKRWMHKFAAGRPEVQEYTQCQF